MYNINDQIIPMVYNANTGRFVRIGDLIDQYGDVAGSALDTIVPGTGQAFSQVFGTISHWIASAIAAPRWSGPQKDLTKLYMVVTGRSLVNNNADVGSNGAVLQGEPIEYTQHLPEAITYFSLKNGQLIDTREKALATLGETWTPGLWNRIYGRDRNWRNVFSSYGLPVPATPYIFGKSGYNYNPVVDALKAGRVTYLNNGNQMQYADPTAIYAGYNGGQAAGGNGSGTGNNAGNGNYNKPKDSGNNGMMLFGLLAITTAAGVAIAAKSKKKSK